MSARPTDSHILKSFGASSCKLSTSPCMIESLRTTTSLDVSVRRRFSFTKSKVWHSRNPLFLTIFIRISGGADGSIWLELIFSQYLRLLSNFNTAEILHSSIVFVSAVGRITSEVTCCLCFRHAGGFLPSALCTFALPRPAFR